MIGRLRLFQSEKVNKHFYLEKKPLGRLGLRWKSLGSLDLLNSLEYGI